MGVIHRLHARLIACGTLKTHFEMDLQSIALDRARAAHVSEERRAPQGEMLPIQE
jgi:hypothetical protein